MSQQKSAYNLGKVYGLAAQALPNKIGTPTKTTVAVSSPLSGLADCIRLLHANNAMSPKLDSVITALLSDVDEDFPANIELDLQGSWWAGYYAAGAKQKKGLAAMRKQARLTQKQVAEAVGVEQKHISRWESGQVTPRIERLQELAALYGCSIEDLGDYGT